MMIHLLGEIVDGKLYILEVISVFKMYNYSKNAF